MKDFDTIIVGAGAAGLYCASNLKGANNLILEKGKRPGLKLLMAGAGQCNITHGGSIKDFLSHYGDHGKSIRSILQRHNNIKLCKFFEDLGVETTEREDGKIFPKSMSSRDILNALLDNSNCELMYNCEVVKITALAPNKYKVILSSGKELHCNNLVIATGGASYPTTGSDGKLAQQISLDLKLPFEPLRPSLTPVFVENYGYSDLSGISFRNTQVIISNKRFEGDLLLTLKNFSGPVIINNARDMKPGDKLQINYLWDGGKGYKSAQDLISKLKKEFPGNGKSPVNYLTENFDLPKRFITAVCNRLQIIEKKVSQLSGAEITELAKALTSDEFTVSGLAGFKEAMATAGGIMLDAISTKTMECKYFPGLYFIGEVLDVDGDTGGYNLQFAYSSACIAADSINNKQS